jgi:hypothetical protein
VLHFAWRGAALPRCGDRLGWVPLESPKVRIDCELMVRQNREAQIYDWYQGATSVMPRRSLLTSDFSG